MRLANRLDRSSSKYRLFDIRSGGSASKITALDIENVESLEQLNGLESIINLAALHRDDIKPVSRYDDVNVAGSDNLCQIARKFDIKKIIFTSSVAIYGFAPEDTDELGKPNYFNDYGRTKYLAEQLYKNWYKEDPTNRTLVIVRPTVIFGEGNRGNVYNLLNQIASRKFVMFGDGKNKKSMAYVENVAAFLEHSLSFKPGLHVYNYIDKPDFDMNSLVTTVRKTLFANENVGIRLPVSLGMAIGHLADVVSYVTGKNLPISSIRVKKFLSKTQFSSSIKKTGFIPPVTIEEGLTRTLKYEFIDDNSHERTYETE